MSRYYGIILLTFILAAAVALNGSSSPVSADSCAAQLGTSSLSSAQYYYNSNVAITVPVSATCSYVNAQLYAVGNAYDNSSNRNLGSVSAVLRAVSGNTFTGQLVFNLSPSIIGHQLQVTVSIYSGYPNGYYGYGANGPLLATAGQLLRVNINNYQTGNSYQYGNCSQNSYCYSQGNYNGNYYGNYYTPPCQSTGNNSTVQCSGYLYEPSNGCIELAIPVDNPYLYESRAYQYYTLQNPPSSIPPIGSWVTVTGQLHTSYTMFPTGASCPGNYITVNSISP